MMKRILSVFIFASTALVSICSLTPDASAYCTKDEDCGPGKFCVLTQYPDDSYCTDGR